MPKSLKDLILKYEGALRIDHKGFSEYDRFRDFASGLIKMKNFNYNVVRMEKMVKFLDERKLGVYSKYSILEMVLRRKAMDEIQDLDKRKGIWLAIDNFMGKEKGRTDLILLYATKHGYEETKKDLETVIEGYKTKVNPQLDLLRYLMDKAKTQKKREWLDQIYENHRQIALTVQLFIIPRLINYVEQLKELRKSEEEQ